MYYSVSKVATQDVFITISKYFSRQRCSIKKDVLCNIQRKTPVLESLFNKISLLRRDPAPVFSYKYYEILKNIYLEEHLWTTPSEYYENVLVRSITKKGLHCKCFFHDFFWLVNVWYSLKKLLIGYIFVTSQKMKFSIKDSSVNVTKLAVIYVEENLIFLLSVCCTFLLSLHDKVHMKSMLCQR